MKVVGKRNHQIFKHHRRGGETVQQQQRGIFWNPGFAIEDLYTTNVNRPVENLFCHRAKSLSAGCGQKSHQILQVTRGNGLNDLLSGSG